MWNIIYNVPTVAKQRSSVREAKGSVHAVFMRSASHRINILANMFPLMRSYQYFEIYNFSDETLFSLLTDFHN